MSDAPTPFEQELDAHPEVIDWLVLQIRRKGATVADAEEVIGTTLYRALMQARKGTGWVPGGKPLEKHLLEVAAGVMKDTRRRWRRKPSAPLEAAPESSDRAPTAEEALIENEEKRSATAKVRAALAEESKGLVPMAILDAWGEGIEGHSELAARIKCSVPDVRAALKRLERCAMRVVGMAQ
jgi:DNA-directed RNA polymerase specialized sigma24 family protein